MRRGGAPPNMKIDWRNPVSLVNIRSTVNLHLASELMRLIR
jgi:hypothetical protein